MGNRFREKVTEEGLTDSSVSRRRTATSPSVGEEMGKRAERGAHSAGRMQEIQGEDAREVENGELNVESDVERGEGQERKPGKSDKVAKGVAKVLGGDILADKLVLKQIPLLLLCLFFLLLLVANRYKVESLSREKLAAQERIIDLREQRIQMQKQYQKSVKISQIAEDLGESGVGITSGPPYEIE